MRRTRYPTAVDPKRVGRYSKVAGAGGGYVWDEVLEYRVWCHPERGAPDVEGGNDYFLAFATYARALAFSRRTPGAEEPLALVRQEEYIDEPQPGKFRHVRKVRVTEWPVEFLGRPKRTGSTIPDFLSPNAPGNRLDILRGIARRAPGKMKAYANFDEYLEAQSPKNQIIIRALRSFVKRIAPKLSEAVKWGNGCWIGGKGPVAYVYSDKEYVQFGFFHGASLKDAEGLLEGKGQYVRHIKVRSRSAIDEAAFAALLRQAARSG